MKRLRTVIVTLMVFVGLAFGAMVLFMYSGVYDVSATVPHTRLSHWVLDTMMESSVEHHAEGVQLPSTYPPADLRDGAREFDGMCAMCHSAPGTPRSPIVQGLYPLGPDLSTAADDWTPQQVFWIVQNGIKMTGMPAFGPTQDCKGSVGIGHLARFG